ncbi:putative protein-like [Capsicum annuum]|nr:putative protein-like [Capsicum annuum]
MKNLLGGNLAGIPLSSAASSYERQPKRLLALSSCEDHIVPYTTSNNIPKLKQRKSVIGKMNKLGERMDCLLQGIREHAGPIAGLLYISTDKIAFCSERSIKFLSPTGKLLRICYKMTKTTFTRLHHPGTLTNVESSVNKVPIKTTMNQGGDSSRFSFHLTSRKINGKNYLKLEKFVHLTIDGQGKCNTPT